MQSEKEEVNSLRVLIVGCGNIAGGFDRERSPDCLPLTHMGAYVRDGRFDVVACVEPDDKRCEKFMEAWQIPAGFRSIDELLHSDHKIDVVSICSTTSSHAHDLEIALRLKPKLIFCEKPVTTSLADARRLVAECRDAKIPLGVNYTRRWDPDVVKLRLEILSGKWGELRSVIGLYNKGILNNGSHMIDLLHFLIGAMDTIKVGRPIFDYSPTDPTVPIWLEGYQGQVPVYLACAHSEDYSIFELQLVFSMGVLTMEDGGMGWRFRRTVDSNIFKGYRVLETGSYQPGEYPRAMLSAISNIFQTINHGEPLASIGESALEAQKLCEYVKQQALLR